MEEGESILEVIYEEDNLEDFHDVEMLDVEEGEFVEENSHTKLGHGSGGEIDIVNQDSRNQNRGRRRSKKNKKKKCGSTLNVTDVNRFVLDTCKHLKERKSYMVYTAVGCLGVSALSELVKEVDAIQACGGQMTADGRRPKTGGGILWNIIKKQEPKVYKEIMKRAKEFEKQFRQPKVRPSSEQNKESSQRTANALTDGTAASLSDGSQSITQMQSHLERSSAEGKRISVHNRIRIPVTYDDLLGEAPKDDPT